MKQKTYDDLTDCPGGDTDTLRPMTVPDELIARLASKCEEIFPLGKKDAQSAITDEEVAEVEQLLKRLTPAPVRTLFREQCCSYMCAESEKTMEKLLKSTLKPVPLSEFTIARLAQSMDEQADGSAARCVEPKCARRYPVFLFSAVAAVAALIGFSQLMGGPSDANNTAASDEVKNIPSANRLMNEELNPPTIFELQGGDERVPVLAPPAIREFLPNIEY